MVNRFQPLLDMLNEPKRRAKEALAKKKEAAATQKLNEIEDARRLRKYTREVLREFSSGIKIRPERLMSLMKSGLTPKEAADKIRHRADESINAC